MNELLEEMKSYEWSLFSHKTHEMIKLRTEALQGRGSLMGIFYREIYPAPWCVANNRLILVVADLNKLCNELSKDELKSVEFAMSAYRNPT